MACGQVVPPRTWEAPVDRYGRYSQALGHGVLGATGHGRHRHWRRLLLSCERRGSGWILCPHYRDDLAFVPDQVSLVELSGRRLLTDSTVQFIGICAFHTQIADPLIGGTYMTVRHCATEHGAMLTRSCSTPLPTSAEHYRNRSSCAASTSCLKALAPSTAFLAIALPTPASRSARTRADTAS